MREQTPVSLWAGSMSIVVGLQAYGPEPDLVWICGSIWTYGSMDLLAYRSGAARVYITDFVVYNPKIFPLVFIHHVR